MDKQKKLYPDLIMKIHHEIEVYNYRLDIILAGISNGKAHIYGVFNPGISQCFDALGFHAIGSGLPHALNTLIARNCNQDTSLSEALLAVYEAKKLAEKAPGVGTKRTDICVITPQKRVEFSGEQIGILNEGYTKWMNRDLSWTTDIMTLLKSSEVIQNGSI